jgi:NAD(P)-dependent dehydrogenase (short-subunit alcohol dehydrogenase family)
MGRFTGKIALVTGSASGIGKAITERLLRDGATVIAADIVAMDQKLIGGSGPLLVPYKLDVTNSDEILKLEHWVREKYKGLDILFNNAGIGGVSISTHEYPIEQFDKVHSVNVRGPFLMLQSAIRLMLESGGGSIVNTASLGGFRASPNSSAYIISKGAMVMMTRAASLEYAQKGIRINAIGPGVVETPIIHGAGEEFVAMLKSQVPQGRIGTPTEVANVATFLADDAECSHITGQIWVIDGGRSAG